MYLVCDDEAGCVDGNAEAPLVLPLLSVCVTDPVVNI